MLLKLIPKQLLEAQLCRHNTAKAARTNNWAIFLTCSAAIQSMCLEPAQDYKPTEGLAAPAHTHTGRLLRSQYGFTTSSICYCCCKWELIQRTCSRHPGVNLLRVAYVDNSSVYLDQHPATHPLISSGNIWANIRLKSFSSFWLLGYCHLHVLVLNLVLNEKRDDQNYPFLNSR